MPRKIKSVARQSRRNERMRSRNDAHLHALNDNYKPQIQKRRDETITPLNDAQRRYDVAFETADIVFGVGPAGTGKTWFAAMRAAEALAAGEIKRIIITRPAVEAGESLGYLPGELDEKYEPYIRPLRDAFDEKFGPSHVDNMIKNGQIDVRPLAFLRGSTIKDAWLLADEMQNATKPQFKMLLSRIGEGAKFVINGDPRQTDLPPGTSGLMDAVNRLEPVTGVEVVKFYREDIVRSGLCQAVVEAYED
ncbi:MAG: phosphate starvation-inducible protein PhoH [Stutzerimonas stutzeri]|nr:MAG: phosphate starvation-inducible protein PhoH [Stutzerimonas stutzeri]